MKITRICRNDKIININYSNYVSFIIGKNSGRIYLKNSLKNYIALHKFINPSIKNKSLTFLLMFL